MSSNFEKRLNEALDPYSDLSDETDQFEDFSGNEIYWDGKIAGHDVVVRSEMFDFVVFVDGLSSNDPNSPYRDDANRDIYAELSRQFPDVARKYELKRDAKPYYKKVSNSDLLWLSVVGILVELYELEKLEMINHV